MGLSGFLYVAIVVGWAVYLVPFALKRYDEAARNRSIDRFSSAMRVLGRRDGAPTQASTAASAAGPVRASRPVHAVSRTTADRAAAKVAARRRRRVLLLLLFVTAATAGVAAFSLAPWWSVAIPGGLVVLWLLLCRRQARRERRARPPYLVAAAAEVPGRGYDEQHGDVEAAVLAADETPVDVPLRRPDHVPPDDEPTVVLHREDLAGADAAAAHGAQGSLWDPVPVTLPTYVHKPRAPRTIRTVDLHAPGAPVARSGGGDEQQSAHSEQAQVPYDQTADGPREGDASEQSRPPQRRAVGE